jgi:hypothetical protein
MPAGQPRRSTDGIVEARSGICRRSAGRVEERPVASRLQDGTVTPVIRRSEMPCCCAYHHGYVWPHGPWLEPGPPYAWRYPAPRGEDEVRRLEEEREMLERRLRRLEEALESMRRGEEGRGEANA